MTQSTEQERASLRAFIEMAEREGFDTAHQWYDAKGWVFFSPSTADCWRYWQAALRAPVVPQGWKITEEMHVAAVKVLHRASGVDGLPQRMVDAMLAAAPQPPEAAQASVSNGTLAAHVMLPCVERIDVLEVAKELKENISAFGDTKGKAKEKAAFYLVSQHEQLLYWQQQVRDLLAANGIEVAP